MKQPDITAHYIWKCDCGRTDLASVSDVLYEGIPTCPTCECSMELFKTGEEHDFKKEPLTSYKVRWEIDVDARNQEDAARRALEIQRDPTSIALVFDVEDNTNPTTPVFMRIDLEE